MTIIDDYAHHPQEIRATLKAARNYPHNLWCVFQPHTYTRTKAFLDEFAEALSMRTKWFWLIFMQPGKRILWGSAPATLRKKLRGWAQKSGIFRPLMKLKIYFRKLYARRFVDNYGGRRHCKCGRKLLRQVVIHIIHIVFNILCKGVLWIF